MGRWGGNDSGSLAQITCNGTVLLACVEANMNSARLTRLVYAVWRSTPPSRAAPQSSCSRTFLPMTESSIVYMYRN